MRLGTCARCGYCCRVASRCFTEDTDALREWAATRGIKLENVEPGVVAMLIESPCGHLLPDNTCDIHGAKPRMCIDYPANADNLLPGCGFYFEE